MQRIHYLDNAATYYRVEHYAKDYDSENWMNANANYSDRLHYKILGCETRIMQSLGVDSGHIFFGGNATSIMHYLYFKYIDPSAYYLIAESAEHNCVIDLSQYDFHVPAMLNGTAATDTRLGTRRIVSCPLVNNLSGAINNVSSISKQFKSVEPNTLVIMDCTAAIGHMELPTNLEDFCDVLFCSGHKFGAEKGLGFAWISKRFETQFMCYETYLGTPDLPGILALTEAFEEANKPENILQYDELASDLHDRLKEAGINYKEFIPRYTTERVGAIHLICLPDIDDARSLQRYLADKGVYVSVAASACAEEADYRQAIESGMNKESALKSVRVSFCKYNTTEDTKALVDGIKDYIRTYIE